MIYCNPESRSWFIYETSISITRCLEIRDFLWKKYCLVPLAFCKGCMVKRFLFAGDMARTIILFVFSTHSDGGITHTAPSWSSRGHVLTISVRKIAMFSLVVWKLLEFVSPKSSLSSEKSLFKKWNYLLWDTPLKKCSPCMRCNTRLNQRTCSAAKPRRTYCFRRQNESSLGQENADTVENPQAKNRAVWSCFAWSKNSLFRVLLVLLCGWL